MGQGESEAISDWLVYSDQQSLVRKACGGTSTLSAPDAKSSDVTGQCFCVLLVP